MQKNIREAILNYLCSVKPGVLLDIPSGNCWLQKALRGPDWEYHGADFYVGTATQNFKKVDLNQILPYPNKVFDYITCLEGLEHIENYHHALREFCRVLKNGGTLLVSTPNPLSIKSRIRFFRYGTFWGFPHLIHMPKEGDHLHITPINLSFLIAFSKKFGLSLKAIHAVSPRFKQYLYLPQACLIKGYLFLKTLFKEPEERAFIRRLGMFNVLLNDGVVVSFTKKTLGPSAHHTVG